MMENEHMTIIDAVPAIGSGVEEQLNIPHMVSTTNFSDGVLSEIIDMVDFHLDDRWGDSIVPINIHSFNFDVTTAIANHANISPETVEKLYEVSGNGASVIASHNAPQWLHDKVMGELVDLELSMDEIDEIFL